MKQFTGFPARARVEFTPIPNVFFSTLLPQITDIAELKVTLHIFWSLYSKRGYPRFLTEHELAGSSSLMNSLRLGGKPPEAVLSAALDMAIRRGTILRVALERGGGPEYVYFLNTESDRRVVSKIRNGELVLSGLKPAGLAPTGGEGEPQPDIFTLYEENIGLLTPMIAEELRLAVGVYPEAWIRDAIKEAVNLNKRSWRYIARILERWSAEGKSHGAYQRDSKEAAGDKYTGQKYGHMARR